MEAASNVFANSTAKVADLQSILFAETRISKEAVSVTSPAVKVTFKVIVVASSGRVMLRTSSVMLANAYSLSSDQAN